MTDQDEQREEREDLDLDAETIKDLDPNQEAMDEVAGGAAVPKPLMSRTT